MWAAIKTDLSEFVTSVAEETDNVTKSVINDEGDVVSTNYDETGLVQSAEDEVVRLMESEDTFSTPLDEADESVQQFIDSFDIEKKTEEISKILEENPETIKVFFEALVPTKISYEIFWQRYFYRCDAERIAKEWKDDLEARNKARAEAIQGGIEQVQNLLGGALNAVSQTLEKVDKTSTSITGGIKEGGMNLFGKSGRPPFVMNTAVDEDEEELGWDDDEEEEEGDESSELENNEITESELSDSLKEQLATAIDERDSLKETVELQRKEIIDLRENVLSPEEAKEIDNMKITLAEREAEIAAMKASMGDDTKKDDTIEKMKKDAAQITALQLDIEKLNSKLSMKDADLTRAKEQFRNAEEEVIKTREAGSSNAKLLQSSLAEAESKIESMNSQVEELKAANEQLEEMKLELQQLESVKKHAKELEQEIEQLKEQVQQGTQHNSSLSSSESTGVKVEAETAESPVNETESADDWGDEDW